MKKTILFFLTFIYIHSGVYAQQAEDALKYSTIGFGSTARSAGLAGAIGAVGNDPASIGYNPAGLAVNRHHVFNVTLSNYHVGTNTTYINETNFNSCNKITLPSIGIIFSKINYNKKKPVVDGWCHYNLGFTINRLSNYYQNFFYSGTSGKSSISDAFATLANKYKDDKNYILTDGGSAENLALQTGLIDNYPIYDSSLKTFVNNYQSNYQKQNFVIGKGPRFTQNGSGNNSGRLTEMNFAGGANYSNKLFIGASLSVGLLKQQSVLIHSESDSASNINDFKSLTYTQWVNTKGTSVGFKLGIIYRVTNAFRIGFAYHTPQVFKMHDEYGYKLSVVKDGNINLDANTVDPGFYYDYTYKQPSKIIMSMAYVKDKAGLLSFDLEIPNYNKALFNDSLNTFKDRNKSIATNYATGVIFRSGGELYIDQIFLRGGVAIYSSPFSNKEFYKDANQAKQFYTLGIGYQTKKYSIDLGYIYGVSKNYFTPYTTEKSDSYYSAINKSVSNQILLTFINRF